jgi:hypothetical protein
MQVRNGQILHAEIKVCHQGIVRVVFKAGIDVHTRYTMAPGTALGDNPTEYGQTVNER